MFKSKDGQNTLPRELFRLDFYGESVLLEFEVGLAYLGMEVVPIVGGYEIAVTVPGYDEIQEWFPLEPRLAKNRWRYRSSSSAGSRKGLWAGFVSRLHNAARYAYPSQRAREATGKLMCIGLLTGQSVTDIRNTVKRLAKAHPHIYKGWLEGALLRALKMPQQQAVYAMQRVVGHAMQR